MEEMPLHTPAENPVGRPNLLTILCILTFIGSGIYFFSSLMTFLLFDDVKAAAPEISKIWKQPGIAEMFVNTSPFFFAWMAGISLLSIAGAVQMWRLRKHGFHIYTVAQILLIIVPMYFFRFPYPDLFNIMLSGVFILLYGSTLKKMK